MFFAKKYLFWLVYGAANVSGLVSLTLIAYFLHKYCGGFEWNGINPSSQFNFHPLFMVLGFVLLNGNAMLIYRLSPSSMDKKIVKCLHFAVNLVSLILGVVGLIAVFEFHNRHGFKNLNTLHSWLGIIVFALFGCQLIGGFASFLFPGLNMILREVILPVHKRIGVIIFAMSIAVCVTGLTQKAIWILATSNPKDHVAERNLVNVAGIFLFSFSGIIGYLVSREK
ncbi:Uncharacterised protein g1877 [Pycnogonum litorale]